MGQGQQALQIDRVCDEFETAWRMDSATRLEAFLSADPANEFRDDDVQNQNVAELFP